MRHAVADQTAAEPPVSEQAAVDARHIAIRYGMAPLGVAAAIATTLWLESLDINITLFAFYAAVVFSAWVSVGTGILSVILSVVAVQYFFTPPGWGFEVAPADIPFTGAFIVCAVMSLAWASQRQRTERVLKEARNLLEKTVRQRTAQLVTANEALKVEMAERQAAELELRDTEARLARMLRVATAAEMTASIAHEINQPLAAIVANASACVRSLSREPPVLSVASEAADCIVKDGMRAGQVITRIRALLAKQEPVSQSLDINGVVQEAVELSRGSIERYHVAVETYLQPALPLVEGDRIQLQQVLLNLITNGIEAMTDTGERPRELAIRTTLADGEAAGSSVEISVEDAGCGLDTAHLDDLFDSFYTTKPEGIGMGLSISRSIIEAHGGHLSAVPRQPYGAKFLIQLPVE